VAHVHVWESDQGWTDEQAVLSLILLNLAGGDCVSQLTFCCKGSVSCGNK